MTDLAMPQSFNTSAGSARPGGLIGSLRYGGVLLVWLALLLVNPPLALTVLAERRPDSPIPRRRRRDSRP